MRILILNGGIDLIDTIEVIEFACWMAAIRDVETLQKRHIVGASAES